MAFLNSGFPATYQPLYQPYAPPTQPQQAPQPAQTGSIVWIQGEQAAKSYLVAPNNTVVLFDSESQSIYIKTADASGMPSMKVLDYTIRDANKATPADTANFATKGDVDSLNKQIKALQERLDKLSKEDAE